MSQLATLIAIKDTNIICMKNIIPKLCKVIYFIDFFFTFAESLTVHTNMRVIQRTIYIQAPEMRLENILLFWCATEKNHFTRDEIHKHFKFL